MNFQGRHARPQEVGEPVAPRQRSPRTTRAAGLRGGRKEQKAVAGGAARVQPGAGLGRGRAERGPSEVHGRELDARTPGACVCCTHSGCGARRARLPATAPSLRPALSPLPPFRLPPASLSPRLPLGAPDALGARRGPRGRSWRPWVRVRELSRDRGPKFARSSRRRRGSPGRPLAPCLLGRLLGPPPPAARATPDAAGPTPRRRRRDGQLEVGTLRAAASPGATEPLTDPRACELGLGHRSGLPWGDPKTCRGGRLGRQRI